MVSNHDGCSLQATSCPAAKRLQLIMCLATPSIRCGGKIPLWRQFPWNLFGIWRESKPDEFFWNLQISHWDRSTSQSNHMNTNDPSWFFRVNLIIWRRQPENIKPFSQNPNKIATRSLPIKKNSTWVNLIGFHIEKTCGSSGFIVHHVPFSVQTDQQPMAWEDLSLSSSKARPKRNGPNLQRLRGSHLSRNQDSKASNKLPVMSPQEFGLQIHCPGDKIGRFFSKKKTRKTCMKKNDVCECSQCPTFRNPYTTGWCVES